MTIHNGFDKYTSDNPSNLLNSAYAINALADFIHYHNVKAGWYDDAAMISRLPEEHQAQLLLMLSATKISLIHSEVTEALEGLRKNLMDDHLPERKMIEVELADAIIRILDLAEFLKLDVGGAIVDKVQYNMNRADHKRENRNSDGGKKI